MIRIGTGYDAHRFCDDRPLILGGVTVPHDKGLLGHSDADVLSHVIMDALLGALNLGCIGRHFPDTDPVYKNASSVLLLEKVMQLIREKKYDISNMDTVLVAEKPKLSPFIPDMQAKLAAVMTCDAHRVSIKATTTEKMGPAGRQEGIFAYATVLLAYQG